MQEPVPLGKLCEPGAKRDAVHVAILPIKAGEDLDPGDEVVVSRGLAYDANGGRAVGIVDPFLGAGVDEGETFYLCLFPNTVTGMTHHWEHPDFPSEVQQSVDQIGTKMASIQWIKNFADYYGETYEDIMDAADQYVRLGYHYSKGGKFEGESVPDEFWSHYTAVTGKAVTNPGSFFSCAC